MKSPLEHKPELVAAIGLLTVRWAALERQLAQLLELILESWGTGEAIYYSLGNFSQRIDLVEMTVLRAIREERHKKIAQALFTKIRRLWKSRNYLVHSHYVYYENLGPEGRAGHVTHLAGRDTSGEIRVLRGTWRTRDADGNIESESGPEKILNKGFGYQRRDKNGGYTIVPVNKGTFLNHAQHVYKRSRQVWLLDLSIRRRIVKLARPPSHGIPPPRSPRARNAVPKPPAGG